MDTLKGLVGKGKEVAAQNAEKIEQAVDKAGHVIDEKTGGKFSAQIDKGTEAVKNAIPTDTAAAEAPAEPAPAEPAPAEPAAEPAPEPAAGEQPPA
ncbi:antitoxin [Nocardia tengchongensis]|uniref:antitoxin n=1 Tax=Nocardia tengchongensis TaxID=2055889 RepID=UPI0036B18907